MRAAPSCQDATSIDEHKNVALDDVAGLHSDGPAEYGRIIYERMKLSVFLIRINAGGSDFRKSPASAERTKRVDSQYTWKTYIGTIHEERCTGNRENQSTDAPVVHWVLAARPRLLDSDSCG